MKPRRHESAARIEAARRHVENVFGIAVDEVDLAALGRARDRAKTADASELAHELLVHETWFFRDPGVFEALAAVARTRAALEAAPMRVLIAPCATGEEAYSIAIALLEAGLTAGSFVVIAADVSADYGNAELQYRIPNQPSLDGNTVDTQVEQAEFTQNAIEYQTSLTFLSGKIRGLLSAIRGD